MSFNEPLLPRSFPLGRDEIIIEPSAFGAFHASSKRTLETFSDPFELAAKHAPKLYNSISYPTSALPLDFYHLAAGARQTVLLALLEAQLPKANPSPTIIQLCEILSFTYTRLYLPDSTLFNRALAITGHDKLRAAHLFIAAGPSVRKKIPKPRGTNVAPLYSFFKIFASDTLLQIRYCPDQTVRRIGALRTKIEMDYYASLRGARQEHRERLILSCIKSFYSADQGILPSIPEDLFRKLKIHIGQMVSAIYNGTLLPDLPTLNFQQPRDFTILIKPPKDYKAPRAWKHAPKLKPDTIYTRAQLLEIGIPKTAVPSAVSDGYLTRVAPNQYKLTSPKQDIDLLSTHYSPEQVRKLGESAHSEDYVEESEYRSLLTASRRNSTKPSLPAKLTLPEDLFDSELSSMRESRISSLYGEEGLARFKRGEEANPALLDDSSVLRSRILPSRISASAKSFPFYGTPYDISKTPILYIPEEELKARGLNPNRKIGSHLLQYLPDYLFEGQFTVRNNEYCYTDSDTPVPFSFQHQLHVLDRLEQETALVFAAKEDFDRNYSKFKSQKPWLSKDKESGEPQCIINHAD